MARCVAVKELMQSKVSKVTDHVRDYLQELLVVLQV